MPYWAEILKGFDNQVAKKTKDLKKRQPVATLALMYLALGMDHPYNMARNFGSILPKDKFSILKYPNKLSVLLRDMEKKALLIKEPDKKVGRGPRSIYKINSNIIQYTGDFGEALDIPPELIKDFLAWLEKSYAEDEKRKEFIKEWISIEQLDFITFLMFLKREALKWESSLGDRAIVRDDLSRVIEEYEEFLEKSKILPQRLDDRIYDFVLNRLRYNTNSVTWHDPREPKRSE